MWLFHDFIWLAALFKTVRMIFPAGIDLCSDLTPWTCWEGRRVDGSRLLCVLVGQISTRMLRLTRSVQCFSQGWVFLVCISREESTGGTYAAVCARDSRLRTHYSIWEVCSLWLGGGCVDCYFGRWMSALIFALVFALRIGLHAQGRRRHIRRGCNGCSKTRDVQLFILHVHISLGWLIYRVFSSS